MTLHRRYTRVVLAAAAAALVVPAAAAANPNQVQIAGAFVAPSQVSSWQSQVNEVRPSPQRVQVGGRFVSPSQVSAVQQDLSRSASTSSSTADDGMNWSAAGAGIAGFALLLGAAGYAVQTRRRLTTASC